MRVGFSSICCPNWNFSQIIEKAKEYGFSSVEIRGIQDELHIPKIKEFEKQNLGTTLAFIKRSRVNISCLTSECYLQQGTQYSDEAKKCIDIAASLDIPYVRVLGDTMPQPGYVDTDLVFSLLSCLDEYAKDSGVCVLIETNGVYANSLFLNQIFKDGNFKNTGVLWDIHHPYVFYNELPRYTYSNIKDYIKHIHIKDSIVTNNHMTYKKVGEGNLPIKQFVKLCKLGGYKGPYTLEWVKRWNNELEDADIVLPHYKSYMNSLKFTKKGDINEF